MGYYSTIFLSPKTNISELRQFLGILKYIELDENYYFFNDNNSAEYFTGVSLTISDNKPENIEIHLNTTVWTSYADTEYTNLTLSEISKRFRGYFITENGKNKYYKYCNTIRKGAEASSYNVFMTFRNNMVKPNVFLQHLESYNNEKPIPYSVPILAEMHPVSIGMNIAVPFLISVFEEYFRTMFTVLLKYSEQKKDVLKSIKIKSEDLFDVSEGNKNIEMVAARTISFQNISSINSAFSKLLKEINIINILKSTKPNEKYYDRIIQLIDFRHLIIHSNQTNPNYKLENFRKDINLVTEICELFYDKLIETNRWNEREY